jgi:histidinol-phosphate aminotransferase
VSQFNKVRSPYNVNVLTQLIAERVLAHRSVLREQALAIREERARLSSALSGMPDVTPFPSEANFILARVPDAQLVHEGLRRRGILIKNMHEMHPLLDQCVRFTIGTQAENTLLIDALRAILNERGVAVADRVG